MKVASSGLTSARAPRRGRGAVHLQRDLGLVGRVDGVPTWGTGVAPTGADDGTVRLVSDTGSTTPPPDDDAAAAEPSEGADETSDNPEVDEE